MNDALSEHIHSTASAISMGLPKRPRGCCDSTHLFTSGSPNARSAIAVSITAGHTAFTRIPAFAHSSAAVRVNPITACLLAIYAEAPAAPISPATDDMFTMAPPPPCFSICGISYFRLSQTPFTLMSITWSNSSSVQSNSGCHLPSMPALLNATSSRPYFSTVLCTNDCTSVALETSPFTKIPSPPADRIRRTVSFPSASRRPVITTLAPSFAKSTAVSRPMPVVPPVISATLPHSSPCRSVAISSPFCCRFLSLARVPSFLMGILPDVKQSFCYTLFKPGEPPTVLLFWCLQLRRPPLPPILSAQSLSKRYGVAPLFQNISFTISEGERIGLIGPNGSGKSTLIEILAGRVKPDTGNV